MVSGVFLSATDGFSAIRSWVTSVRSQIPDEIVINGVAVNTLWLLGAGVTGILLVVAWILTRRKHSASTQACYDTSEFQVEAGQTSTAGEPVQTELLHPDSSTDDRDSTMEWRQRALAAEQRAMLASAIARQSVSGALQKEAVQHLAAQHAALLENQNAAADQMIEFEERLGQLQAPLEGQMKAYESRIAELESQLALKDQENRTLAKARLEQIRAQVARAKATRSCEWS